MDYPIKNDYHLRNIAKEIEDRKEAEGKATYIYVDTSKAKGELLQAKRGHIKNQVLSRLESSKIIFNA
jgi:hypothetical protein